MTASPPDNNRNRVLGQECGDLMRSAKKNDSLFLDTYITH